MEHTLIYPPGHGNEYVGLVPAGQHTGTGVFRCVVNGNVYCGEYQGRHMHGVGTHTYATGCVYRGQLQEGNAEGHGVYECPGPNGLVYRYRGQWKGDAQEGHGGCTTDGYEYYGQWKAGIKEGHVVRMCAMVRPTFEQYEGNKRVSSVPFQADSPLHAGFLREAKKAEACRAGAPHLRWRVVSRLMRCTGGGNCTITGSSCSGAHRAACADASVGARTRW